MRGLVAAGLAQDDICEIMEAGGKPIAPRTLRKHFAREIAKGTAEANGKVAATLYQNAINPDPKFQTSRIFWLKARAGWRDGDAKIELPLPDAGSGGDVKVIVEYADKPIPQK